MDFFDLIVQRESIRNFDTSRPVPREVLEKILKAGSLALSACNLQPWKFIVVSSEEGLRGVHESYRREWFCQAPHVLVVAGRREYAWFRSFDGHNSVETDCAIALTHIMLAARNEGVGACWVEAYDPAILKRNVNPGDDFQIFGICPLGYPKNGFRNIEAKNRKPLSEIVEYR